MIQKNEFALLLKKNIQTKNPQSLKLVHLALDNPHLLHRSIVLVALDQPDSLHRIHAGVDATENRMNPVQPLGGRQSDEELRSVGVRSGIRHRQDAGAGVLQI